MYGRESDGAFFNIVEVDAYVPAAFGSGQRREESEADEAEGQFRIRSVIDPDSCRDKLSAYLSVQKPLAPEDQAWPRISRLGLGL